MNTHPIRCRCSPECIERQRAYKRAEAKRNSSTYRAYRRKWAKENPEKTKEIKARDYARNRETYLAYSKRYREQNREKLSQYQKEYRARNKDYFRDYLRSYMRTNKERYREKIKARQKAWYWKRKAAKGGKRIYKKHLASLREFYKDLCAYCGQRDPDTFDHVVPLMRGGPHDVSNLVPACRSCNSMKQQFTGEEFRPGWKIGHVVTWKQGTKILLSTFQNACS